MQYLYAVLLLGEFAVGIVIGMVLMIARYERAEVRRQAYEEELADEAERYAAWAALRSGSDRLRPAG